MNLPKGEAMIARRALLRALGWLGAAGLMPDGVLAGRPQAFPAVQALLDGYLARGLLPGAMASVGFGLAPPRYLTAGTIAFDSRRPVDATALWRAYSMTKPITGMMAMMLIGEGRFGLDTPVSEFIPAFARMRVLTHPETSLDSVPARTPITIRNLLTHTAGLGYDVISKGPLLDALRQAGVMPRRLARADDAATIRAPSLAVFAERLATLPLVAEPGTRWSYSVALDLLGRVIEIVVGRPYDEVLKARIFDPLGMTETFFRVPAARARDLTTTYLIVGGKPVAYDPGPTSLFLDAPPFPSGGVGLVCSAHDYDRFLTMLIGEGAIGRTRIMAPETVRLGMSNLLPPGVDPRSLLIPGGFGAGGRVSLSGPDKGGFGWGRCGGHDRMGRSRARAAADRLVAIYAGARAPVPAGGGARGLS